MKTDRKKETALSTVRKDWLANRQEEVQVAPFSLLLLLSMTKGHQRCRFKLAAEAAQSRKFLPETLVNKCTRRWARKEEGEEKEEEAEVRHPDSSSKESSVRRA